MQDRLAELGRHPAKETERGDDVLLEVWDERKGGEPIEESMEKFEQLKEFIEQITASGDRIKQLKQQSNKECTREAQKAIFDELEHAMSNTHSLAKKAQAVMTECRRQNIRYAESNPGSPSLIFRQNILNTHARQYQKSVEHFQRSSEEFKHALTQKITRQARIVNKDITDDEIESLIQSKDPGAFMKAEMMGPHAQVLDRVVEIEERHEGILRIEEGVRQIQELFNDLAFLVEVQGEKLQNIEENVMQTSEYAKEAVVHMKKAEESAIKARKKQCYILLCCLVILLIILIPTLTAVLPNA